jgi:hypothetical protein
MVIMAIKAIAFVAFFGATFKLINQDAQIEGELKKQIKSSKETTNEEISLIEKKNLRN